MWPLIDMVLSGVELLLLVRVLLSWLPQFRDNQWVQFVYSATDPILRPFQNLIPTGQLGIDLSPMFVFIAIGILKQILFRILG